MSLGEMREAAIIATLIDRIAASGKFCGETLIQKSVFFLEKLFDVPLSAKFRLYYYGPFSFDLREQLQGMQADDFVKVRPHERGATYIAGERYAILRRQFPKTIASHDRAIEFAALELAKLGVKDLEPLATALYLTSDDQNASIQDRARKLHSVKPHVETPTAIQSVEQIDAWIKQYAS